MPEERAAGKSRCGRASRPEGKETAAPGRVRLGRKVEAVAGVLKTVCRRPRDLVARYGGEEMAVILPDTDSVGAISIAKEILQKLRDLGIAHANNLDQSVVTASAGVYAARPTADVSVTALIQRADVALYAAKSDGRNRVFCFDTERSAAVAV